MLLEITMPKIKLNILKYI